MNDFNAQIPDNCLSLTELHAVARGASDRDDEHLATCLRCEALLRLIESQPLSDDLDPVNAPIEVDDDYLVGLAGAQVPDRSVPDQWVFGELLSVSAPGRDELLPCALLAMVEGGRVLQVAPVTTNTAMAAEWDLLIPAGEAALGYDVAVEVWNHGPVNPDQVAERFGTISDDLADELRHLYDALYEDAERPNVRTGVPIESETDPRFAFQLGETERARSYWVDPGGQADVDAVEDEDAEHAAETALDPAVDSGAFVAISIGRWFGDWLQDHGNEPEDLAREASWQVSDVELLLADRLFDDARLLQADYLARALAATKIDEFEAEELLQTGVNPAGFAETVPTELSGAVFRRGGGHHSVEWRWVGPPSEAGTSGAGVATERQRQVQKLWTSKVLDALAEQRGD